LAVNATTNLTLTVSVGGNVSGVTNVASVWGPYDPYPTNTPPVITTVTIAADVAVYKTGPVTGFAGSNLTYSVTVTNNGPNTASNVLVYDQLPVGFTFVSAAPTQLSLNNNLVSWTGFNLASGAKSTFTVTAVSTQGGVYTNVAYSTATTPDPNPTNNNGSLPTSQAVTTVSPVADVALFKTGTTVVAPGGSANYILIATNYGPSTASNVVVSDIIPPGFTVQSEVGGTVTGGQVVWPGVTLAPNAVVNYSLTLTAPAYGTFTNIGLSTSSTPDPNTNNNNGSSPSSQVVTAVKTAADVMVLLSGPTNVLVSSNFVYTISVTNLGPSVASNVLVHDTLPSILDFISATTGGGLTNSIYTWPVIPLLAAGSGTNFSITVYATTVITFTNVAYSTATSYDPNLTNNNGSLPASQCVTYADQVHLIPQNLSLLVNSNNFNPQSSLYEELVVVTNIGTATAQSVRLTVAGLPSFVTLYNATGTNAGIPYVQNNFPLPPGGTVDFVLEFYDSLRQPFTNIVSAVEVQPAAAPVIPTNAVAVPITAIFQSHININGNVDLAGTSRYVIEFPTMAGHTYTILYTDDLLQPVWYVVTPYIVANASVVQWYDDGPPKTQSPPSSVGARFYRVVELY
jgi:uncharacterized repeat protein (TIGR01451 family)